MDLIRIEGFATGGSRLTASIREDRSVKDAVHRIGELRRQDFRRIVDADIEQEYNGP